MTSKILIFINTLTDNFKNKHINLDFMVDKFDIYDISVQLRHLGHEVYFSEWRNVIFTPLPKVTHLWFENEKIFVADKTVTDFDLVWIYKTRDHYKYPKLFFDFIDNLSKATTKKIINDPMTIIHNYDKSYLFELQRKKISTVPTFPINDELLSLVKKHKLIIKPKIGACGYDVNLIDSAQHIEKFFPNATNYIAQLFQPCVKNGDFSFCFIGNQYLHSFLRKPPENSIFASYGAGSVIARYYPSANEIDFAYGVLQAYADLGYKLSITRIDIFKDKKKLMLSEVEAFNPAILSFYAKMGPMKVAMYIDGLLTNDF